MTAQKFVFVHIPKAAGTSVIHLLNELFPGEVSAPFQDLDLCRDAAAVRHLSGYRIVSGHISGRDAESCFPDRRRFTFLREPIERCLSAYTYFRQLQHYPLLPLDDILAGHCSGADGGSNHAAEIASLAKHLGPDEFFLCRHWLVRQAVQDRMAWQIGDHARPAIRSLLTPKELVEKALRALESYVFVGFVDRIAADLQRLLEALGVAGTQSLPRLNESGQKLGPADLGSHALRELRRLTANDRRLYDAAQDRFVDRPAETGRLDGEQLWTVVEATRAATAETQARLTDAVTRLAEMEDRCASSQVELTSAQAALALTQAELLEARGAIAEATARSDVLVRRLAESDAGRADAEARLLDAEARLAQTEEHSASTQTELATTQAELSSARAGLIEARATIVETISQSEELRRRLAQSEASLAEAQARLAGVGSTGLAVARRLTRLSVRFPRTAQGTKRVIRTIRTRRAA